MKFAKRCETGMRLASDYTVMIGNVHQDELEHKIINFIDEKVKIKNLDPVKIVKINLATYGGNIQICEKIAKEEQSKIEVMEKYL
jgi:hypothetical protein